MNSTLLKKDAAKKDLIDRLSRENHSLMFFYDETPEGAFSYDRIGESITVVRPPYDYEELEKWLYLGNWQAIVPGNANYEPMDTFRAAANDIERQMNESGIELIIDSFHDNIEWNVIDSK